MAAQAHAQALPQATADQIFSVAVRHRILIMLVNLAVIGAVAATIRHYPRHRFPMAEPVEIVEKAVTA